MNILFISCWYPHKENKTSGLFVKEHARAVAMQPGVQVKVFQITTVKGPDVYRKEVRSFKDENGLDTHQVLVHSRFYKLLYLLNGFMIKVSISYFNEVLGNWKPDLIHGHVVFQAGVISATIAKKIDVPLVISEHWSGLRWYVKTPYVYSGQGVQAYRMAQRIFPVSNYLKHQISTYIARGLPMRVVPNAVDTGLFQYAEQQGADKIRCLCIVSFIKVKRPFKLPYLIVRALQKLSPALREKLEITMVGSGQEKEQFCNTVKEANLAGNFKMHDYLPKEQIAGLMQNSDFLLHPTRAETFGLVVAEALNCGLPCVVSDVPAINEMVDRDCGILVKPNTGDAWSEALAKLPEKKDEFDRRVISRRFKGLFTPKNIGKTFAAEYSKILS